MNCKEFCDWLFDRETSYNKLILPYVDNQIWPLAVDVRLLPNSLRAIYSLNRKGYKKASIARRLRLPYHRVIRLSKLAESIIHSLLSLWLISLPRRKRKKEENKRSGMAWIIKVRTGKWKEFTGRDHTYDRLNVVCPDLSSSWKRSNKTSTDTLTPQQTH